ncbi:molybdopterin-dependent oxidoreductase [uncultured Methanoregula sp.]|uniref:molybdopterin-dependent oxidoreductase n=1 Tax=uncultured Methanoregula sp. TaxID=1005933 RepID=UPI002AAB9ADE|nr:molybdopterin-dependent oxidoreductase [uncultured Methanoregula sp.]
MNNRTIFIILLLLVMIAATLFVVLRVPAGINGSAPGGPASLGAVEVRSYQGKDLSSVHDFRENSIEGPQHINISDYRLTVTGLTGRTVVRTYDEILTKYPHYTKVVTLHCVEGWDATILWEGMLVRDILAEAKPDPRANTVIFTARDGYTTSFPLAYFYDRDILLAYRMNNVTMPEERGYPFGLVAEDKWGYKWIKWVEKIELSDDPSYQGYWEARGYSNNGDLNQSMYR